MNHLIASISFGLAIAAFIIFILATLIVYKKVREREFDDIFWFSLAIALGWFSTLYFRTMYLMGHYSWLDRTKIDENHWSVPVMLFGTLLAGVVHIRTLSWHRNSRIWQWSSLLLSSAIILAYWFLI